MVSTVIGTSSTIPALISETLPESLRVTFKSPGIFKSMVAMLSVQRWLSRTRRVFRAELLRMNLQSATNIVQLSLQRLKNVLMHSRSFSVLVALQPCFIYFKVTWQRGCGVAYQSRKDNLTPILATIYINGECNVEIRCSWPHRRKIKSGKILRDKYAEIADHATDRL